MEEYISKTDLLYFLEKMPSMEVVQESEDTTNGWIKVEEEKPKRYKDVLVSDGHDRFVAWYGGYDGGGLGSEWHTRDSGYNPQLYPIKAWQPLPKPYRDEE